VTALETLIVGLVDTLPEDAGSPEAGIRVELASIDLAIPVEAHVDADGHIRASLPRGRLSTGFDSDLCRMGLRYERTEAT
jgi:hypothetical protein